MEKVTWLEKDLYDKARASLPFCAVDLLIMYNNTFLLSKRSIPPGKGEWYPVGGRIFRNEPLLEAVQRKAHEELGLTITTDQISQLGAEEYIVEGQTADESRHDVIVVYMIALSAKPSFSIDTDQLSEVQWFDKIDRSWHPYVKKILLMAQFDYEPKK